MGALPQLCPGRRVWTAPPEDQLQKGDLLTHLPHRSSPLASSPPWEEPWAWGQEQWAVSHTRRARPGFT